MTTLEAEQQLTGRPETDRELVTARQAAALLGVSLGVARDMVKNGRLGPRVRRGGADYVEVENVLVYRPCPQRGGRAKASAVAEDAAWLLRCGEEADTIRRRCGYATWNSFSAVLTRNGHKDLVDRIAAWTAACGHTTAGGDLRDDRTQYSVR